MAWLTTVSPTGKPESVPVWFLLREDDETVLLYSEPGKPKLRHIAQNPQVALGLDVAGLREGHRRKDALGRTGARGAGGGPGRPAAAVPGKVRRADRHPVRRRRTVRRPVLGPAPDHASSSAGLTGSSARRRRAG